MHSLDLLFLLLDVLVIFGLDEDLLFGLFGKLFKLWHQFFELFDSKRRTCRKIFEARLVRDLALFYLIQKGECLFGRCEMALLQKFQPFVDLFTFTHHLGIGVLVDKPQFMAVGHEAQIGVVLSQQQSKLRTTRKHPIGLFGPFGHQIVDQHSDVGLVSSQNERLFTFDG